MSMKKFSDCLSKEVYRSVYNRVKSVKSSWWVCISEGKYHDGEFIIAPHYVVSKHSNHLEALKNMIDVGLDLNMLIARTIRPPGYEWENESVQGDLEEVSLNFSLIRVTRKGETVLWNVVEPEELSKECL